MTKIRKTLFFVVCGAVSLAVGYGLITYATDRPKVKETTNRQSVGIEASDDGDLDIDTSVRAIHPKRDPSLVISVQQLLTVEPFFLADLRAQVAGSVRYIQKDIGDPVFKGELLVAIEVPQLEQDVQASKAVVEQRKTEYKLALAQVENARAFADVSRETIDQRKSEVLQAEATRDYRKMRVRSVCHGRPRRRRAAKLRRRGNTGPARCRGCHPRRRRRGAQVRG